MELDVQLIGLARIICQIHVWKQRWPSTVWAASLSIGISHVQSLQFFIASGSGDEVKRQIHVLTDCDGFVRS